MKKYFNKINNTFGDFGIRDKLLLVFITLISLPVLIIGINSYNVSTKIIEDKTNKYSHDILYQTKNMLENRLEKIEDISFNIFVNQDVQNIMADAIKGKLEGYEAIQKRTRMEKILSSQVLYHDEINSIYVVSFGGYVYKLDKTMQNYGLMEDKLESISEGKGAAVWFGGSSENQVVTLTRIINNIQTQKPMGYMVIYVDERYLFDLIASTYSVNSGGICIVDSNGMIVSDADKTRLGIKSDVDAGEQTLAYSFTSQKVNGAMQYIAKSEPMSNGWRIIATVPVMIYQREINSLKNSIIFLAVILFIISVFCAWGLSQSVTLPIRRLSGAMERFGKGDFSARCPENRHDETGRLAATFNKMAEDINTLVQEVFDEQQMKREAELKSLQMQINPHFLNNTLETINWMARMHGTEDIGIMAKSLGDLMRATINGKDYVRLSDEITNLQNYLQIQKYRYGNKLEVFLNIAQDTKKLYVPKLIIQPIVENAIYHGIEPALDKGRIEVSSVLKGKELLIIVADSGVGMSEKTIKNILDSSSPGRSSTHSIGLKNVIKRIKTLFGDQFGIQISSELGDGTEVMLTLPAISKLEERR